MQRILYIEECHLGQNLNLDTIFQQTKKTTRVHFSQLNTYHTNILIISMWLVFIKLNEILFYSRNMRLSLRTSLNF